MFRLEGAKSPGGWYDTAMSTTESILAEYGLDRIEEPEVQAAFFRRAYANGVGGLGSKSEEMQEKRRARQFRWVGQHTRFIDEEYVNALILDDETGPFLEESLRRIKAGFGTRQDYRTLAKYSVSLRKNGPEAKRDVRSESGLIVWREGYHRHVGIGHRREWDSADMIA